MHMHANTQTQHNNNYNFKIFKMKQLLGNETNEISQDIEPKARDLER